MNITNILRLNLLTFSKNLKKMNIYFFKWVSTWFYFFSQHMSLLDQDLMYLVMFSRNRFVSVPTHLELFQIGGDSARPDWQTAHWPDYPEGEYSPEGDRRSEKNRWGKTNWQITRHCAENTHISGTQGPSEPSFSPSGRGCVVLATHRRVWGALDSGLLSNSGR